MTTSRKSAGRVLAPLAATALASIALYGAAPTAYAAENPVSATNGFYVDPGNAAAQWAAANPSDGRAAAIAANIGDKPQADWFGSWSTDPGEETGAYVGAAAAADKLPVLVAYNIPDLDICASGPGLGASSDAAYDTWNGSDGQWCNPDGAKLGSTDQIANDGAELLLWIKTPGESDGNCGTGDGTTAGQFVPQIAYDLVYGY